jgi:cytochrome c
MKNCFDGKPILARISGSGISDYEPPIVTKRGLPVQKEGKAKSKAQKMYESSCSVCHGTDSMGAPMIGSKKAWESVLKKGIDIVYDNALHGVNGMPAKGGTTLSDEKIKEIVDYMVSQSK